MEIIYKFDAHFLKKNMDLIYHFGLYLFKVLLIVVSPFNKKASLWLQGRKDMFSQIQYELKKNEKRVWLHAASLGEFEQGRPIIEALKKKYPEQKIVLTFFSPSGFEIQKSYEYADYVFYLPLDTKRNAKRFIELLHPEYVIFIKYEFWRNFLYVLRKQNIPTYLVSAIFRRNQVFFRWYGGWYRRMLHTFDHFFVQNQESEKLLQELGFENVTISGDTRFDRVSDIAAKAKSFPLVEQFCNNHTTLIVGSSWKADEEILFDFMNDASNKIKVIIAPHEIHDSNVERIISRLTKRAQRYSKATEENVKDAEVLIIDNIGMLSSIYQYGKVAYIGGGFGSGIHNVIEAATFGLPVLFGPNYKKFKEAVDLIKLEGALEVKDKVTVTKELYKLLSNQDYLKAKSETCKRYVENQKGATATIVNYLTNNT
jgi:3-deoxy-D-manno-octulosonic-acid transferase